MSRRGLGCGKGWKEVNSNTDVISHREGVVLVDQLKTFPGFHFVGHLDSFGTFLIIVCVSKF